MEETGHKGKRNQYTKEQMHQAFKLWEAGVTISKAAKLMGVPRTTLSDKTSGTSPFDCLPGRRRLFTDEEEAVLVGELIASAGNTEGYTRKQLVTFITDIAVQWKKRPSTDKPLCDKWLTKFLKRHPELKAVQRKK